MPHMTSQGNDTPCNLLLNINGQVVDVAKASLMNPLYRVFHHAPMPDNVFKVMVYHLLSNEYSKLPLPIPSTGEVRPEDLGGSKGWVILWPKVLIRAELVGAMPTQVNATFTPPMQFPSFGLGDHGSGREGGSTVPVAHHAAPVDPSPDNM